MFWIYFATASYQFISGWAATLRLWGNSPASGEQELNSTFMSREPSFSYVADPWSFLNNLPLNCMEIAWGCMGNVLFKVSQERPQHHQPRHWFTDAGTANTTFSDNMTDILCEIQDRVRLEIQHVSTWTSKWFNAAHQPISPSASWLWRSSGATSATKAAACTAEWPELWNRLCHAT